MYKITGKQQFGAVWGEGQCLAIFRKGTAHTNDPAKAKALEALGYTVEGEADKPDAPEALPEQPGAASAESPADTSAEPPAEAAEPAKTSKKKGG